jgi:hypothetical protein
MHLTHPLQVSQSQFMYRILGADGKVYGPISADLLRQWIAESRANAATYALPEGATEWKPLSSLLEFSLSFTAAPQPGTPAVFSTGTVSAQKTSGFATAGLVLGIISLTVGLCCCYGLPFNITGLIFSIVALGQINNDPARYGGKGMAITGLVLCMISLAVMVILFLVAAIGAGLGPMTHHAYRL